MAITLEHLAELAARIETHEEASGVDLETPDRIALYDDTIQYAEDHGILPGEVQLLIQTYRDGTALAKGKSTKLFPKGSWIAVKTDGIPCYVQSIGLGGSIDNPKTVMRLQQYGTDGITPISNADPYALIPPMPDVKLVAEWGYELDGKVEDCTKLRDGRYFVSVHGDPPHICSFNSAPKDEKYKGMRWTCTPIEAEGTPSDTEQFKMRNGVWCSSVARRPATAVERFMQPVHQSPKAPTSGSESPGVIWKRKYDRLKSEGSKLHRDGITERIALKDNIRELQMKNTQLQHENQKLRVNGALKRLEIVLLQRSFADCNQQAIEAVRIAEERQIRVEDLVVRWEQHLAEDHPTTDERLFEAIARISKQGMIESECVCVQIADILAD